MGRCPQSSYRTLFTRSASFVMSSSIQSVVRCIGASAYGARTCAEPVCATAGPDAGGGGGGVGGVRTGGRLPSPRRGHGARTGPVGVILLPLAAGVISLASGEGDLGAAAEERLDDRHHLGVGQVRCEALVQRQQPRHVPQRGWPVRVCLKPCGGGEARMPSSGRFLLA